MEEAVSTDGMLEFLLGLPEFKKLGSVALLDIEKEIRAENIQRGDSLNAFEQLDRHLYLIEGEVNLMADGKVLQVVNAGSERAKHSLFRIHTDGLTAYCVKNARLLALNKTILDKYISTINPDTHESGISVTSYDGLDSEAGIIRDIQNEFSHGEVDLPSITEVALKINQAVKDESLDFNKIADIVQTDPMIASRAVHVANSAIYMGSQPVKTVKRAVQRIGLRAMRTIVMSVTLLNLFSPKSPLVINKMRSYYKHSIRVGVICHVLAKNIKGFDPEQAFLAGLIHDIGTVPILIKIDEHNEIKDDAEILEKLISSLKIKVGTMLLKQWNFEDELIEVTKNADNWSREVDKADYCDLVQVAQLHSEMIGGNKLNAPALSELAAFKRLNIMELNPVKIISQAKEEMSEIINLLE